MNRAYASPGQNDRKDQNEQDAYQGDGIGEIEHGVVGLFIPPKQGGLQAKRLPANDNIKHI